MPIESRGCVAHRIGQIALAALLFAPAAADAFTGKVIDASTRRPIENAIVTLRDKEVRTNFDGVFKIDGAGDTLGVRATGYSRTAAAAGDQTNAQGIELKPFRPKALYLSFYGIGSTELRNAALKLIEETELNARRDRRQGRSRHGRLSKRDPAGGGDRRPAHHHDAGSERPARAAP